MSDPDWGRAGTETTTPEALPIFDDGAPVPGWWTYLSPRAKMAPTLPPEAREHAVGDRGVRWWPARGIFNASDEAYARAVDEVRAAMEAAGVLRAGEEGAR